MKLFIGLDVLLAKTAVCVISEHGRIVKEAETGSEPAALARWLKLARMRCSWKRVR